MFGLGMPEILLILAIALIVIGPKKLPELAKTLGRAMGEFKRSAQDFKRSIDIETTVRDIDPPPSKDIKEVVKEVNKKPSPADAAPQEKDTGGDTPAANEAGSGDADNSKASAASEAAPNSSPSNG